MLKRSLLLLAALLCASPAFAQRDAIDLSAAVVHNSPLDVASWPVTTRVEQLKMAPEGSPDPGISMQFSGRQRWPDYTPPGWDGPIQYTIWAGINRSGVWHVAGFMQMWRERVATGAPLLTTVPTCQVNGVTVHNYNNFACNWAYDSRWGTAMAGYQPRAGEEMVFFATAGNARGIGAVTSVRERTNVVKVALPANDSNTFTFAAAQTDLLIDMGAPGLWNLIDSANYGQLHAVDPKSIAAGDLDGNGFDEAIVDFGTNYGIWVKWNSGNWAQLHPLSANSMIAGDIDQNGRADVIVDFPGYGVFAYMNGASWAQIHGMNATKMAITRTGTLVLNFPGYGIWVRANTGVWTQLHPLNSEVFETGDFNGDGAPDVAVSFAGHGLWVFSSGAGAWFQVNNNEVVRLAVGDMDTVAADDLLLDFGGSVGIWALRNGTTWGQIHTAPSKSMAIADLNGNGLEDLVIDFGPSHGVWVLGDLSTWVQATASSTDSFVKGHFN